MKSKYFTWSLVAALSGLLFGYDTAVISGADQPIQELWGLSDLYHGLFIMSVALWGTVIGALFGGIPCDRFGRRPTLIWIGVLYFVSAMGSAVAWDPVSFSFFRFIGGLGVGASSVAAPAYISEIAPTERRGRLVILYQFTLVFGIMLAYICNFFIGFVGEGAWRWMLGAEALPAAIYLYFVLRVSESPRWLVLFKKDETAARGVLEQIHPAEHVDEVVQRIHDSGVKLAESKKLLVPKFRIPILFAFLVAFFNQVSGINFVIYYAPRIFDAAGFAESTALLSTAGIGVVNLVVTMLGIYLIDRAGRKTLMIIGSVGYIVSLAVLSYTFFRERFDGAVVPVFIFLFVASHAIGQGSVIWVFISEIFPNSVRGKGQSLGSGTHWVFAALITLTMPFILNNFSGGPIFAFFGVMMVLQLLWAVFIMPETKGISLEELEKKLLREDPPNP
jgi:sugar porter (SP) family MFS transporter